MKTMLDILKQRLPDGLEVIKTRERNCQLEIHFRYQGMEEKTWLFNSCIPNMHNTICDRAIANVMMAFALKSKDIEMAAYWLNEMSRIPAP